MDELFLQMLLLMVSSLNPCRKQFRREKKKIEKENEWRGKRTRAQQTKPNKFFELFCLDLKNVSRPIPCPDPAMASLPFFIPKTQTHLQLSI